MKCRTTEITSRFSLMRDGTWCSVTTINVRQAKGSNAHTRGLVHAHDKATRSTRVYRGSPIKEEERANRKLRSALVAVLAALFVGYAMWVSKSNASAPWLPYNTRDNSTLLIKMNIVCIAEICVFRHILFKL